MPSEEVWTRLLIVPDVVVMEVACDVSQINDDENDDVIGVEKK